MIKLFFFLTLLFLVKSGFTQVQKNESLYGIQTVEGYDDGAENTGYFEYVNDSTIYWVDNGKRVNSVPFKKIGLRGGDVTVRHYYGLDINGNLYFLAVAKNSQTGKYDIPEMVLIDEKILDITLQIDDYEGGSFYDFEVVK